MSVEPRAVDPSATFPQPSATPRRVRLLTPLLLVALSTGSACSAHHEPQTREHSANEQRSARKPERAPTEQAKAIAKEVAAQEAQRTAPSARHAIPSPATQSAPEPAAPPQTELQSAERRNKGVAKSTSASGSGPGAAGHGAAGLGLSGIGSGGGGKGVGFGVGHGRLGGAHYAAGGTGEANTERYDFLAESTFVRPSEKPLSTFAADVDTASYANVRRFLNDGSLPPPSAVRVEELVNYFDYDYPLPQGDVPFAVSTEVSTAPWDKTHKLVHIGIKTRAPERTAVAPLNLVFLIDVSGSMHSEDKLPLLKRGLELLVRELRPQDRVALVVYAGASGVVLPSTSGSERQRISEALGRLEAGGSTNGAEGIQLAYSVAEKARVKGSTSRVILATDGDFNVGTTSEGELVSLIEQKRKGGVSLTVLGFGRGNLNDSSMEKLADHGNGNYAYVDSLEEARKVLVREGGATLVTVAQDVKFQIEPNPRLVGAYRLIGYENRALAARDFNDDKKDAGEVGAGHSVTALYEVVPAGEPVPGASNVDPLKYQAAAPASAAAQSDELMTLKIRYKPPGTDKSQLSTYVVHDDGKSFETASQEHRFSAGVAAFGMKLKDSPHVKGFSLAATRRIVESALGADAHGERRELVKLIDKAKALPR